ncbi:MAG TPA: hypothetical protein VGD49_09430, partial [Longimicrobiales bacterium]
ASDFGTVQGVELTMRARWSGFSVRAGWALQKAMGVSSGLENDSIQGENPALNEFPLAFDRRHSGDFALFIGRGAGAETPWSVAFTATVQSGYPLRDSRLPWTHNADLRASWDFARALVCSRCHWRVVFDGRNILGAENILALRSETGSLSPTLAQVQQLANAQPVMTESIPRESPSYVELLDFNRDGVITPAEANAARFAAALDRFDPTLFIGEGRQLRLGVEIAF